VVAATHTIHAFCPRDVLEAEFAGRCMMYHEVIADSVRRTLSGGDDASKRSATQRSIVAMDRAFGINLDLLVRFQKQRTKPLPEAEPALAGAETDIADRVQRHQPAPPPAAPHLAACGANPEAMAALDAADPIRFAKAMGIDNPRADYVAAARIEMAALNAQAGIKPPPAQPGGNREARRHPTG
jgi:hypothetical protein